MDDDTFMELRKGAITEAKKTARKCRLGITDLSVVKLLDVIRKADWTHDSEGQPVIRPLEVIAHSSALLLQERGIKPQSAMRLVHKNQEQTVPIVRLRPGFPQICPSPRSMRQLLLLAEDGFCGSWGKNWMFTLDLTVLQHGGLLYAEGMGRRLKGLPPLQSTSRTPAIITRKAVSSKPTTGRQPPPTESKVESRRGDKSSLSTRRLAGNSSSATVLGKRSAAPSIEPPTKRTRHSEDRDAKLVPWPCTSASWNDTDALKTVDSDLQGHMRAVKRRTEELEAGSLETKTS